MRRLFKPALLLAVFVFAAAACSSSTSSGYTDSSGDKITSYALADGSYTYELSANAKGTIGLGESLEDLLPDALKGALAIFGKQIPIEMGYTATADATVSSTSDGQTIDLTYTSVEGSVDFATQKSSITLKDLDGDKASYELASDGTLTAKTDPLGSRFWITGGGLTSCPKLPAGGAANGQSWDAEEDLKGVLGFITSPIKFSNNYAVDGGSATVKGEADNLDGLEVSTKDIIDRINTAIGSVLNAEIPVIDVKAALKGTGNFSTSCSLSVPAQELAGMEQKFEIDGDLEISGSSLPSGVEPGSFVAVKLDATSSLKSK